MILKTLKKEFYETLQANYPETEIHSFFNLLVEQILNIKRHEIALNLYAVVSSKMQEKFKIAIERLKKNEPIQYIIGDTEFYGLPFKLNNHTLIPRPETEELVDWIIKEHSNKNSESNTILDVGTGSGCIAICLGKTISDSSVYGLDVSDDALQIAKQNAEVNEVDINLIHADILKQESLHVKFDIIVSNPPYVRDQEKALMHKNVLDYEPETALFVENENPLMFYKAITEFALHHLKPSGALYFEINEYLGEETKALVESLGFKNVVLKKDLFGKDRMLKGIKK